MKYVNFNIILFYLTLSHADSKRREKVVRLKDDSSAREWWCGCEIRRSHKAAHAQGAQDKHAQAPHI